MICLGRLCFHGDRAHSVVSELPLGFAVPMASSHLRPWPTPQCLCAFMPHSPIRLSVCVHVSHQSLPTQIRNLTSAGLHHVCRSRTIQWKCSCTYTFHHALIQSYKCYILIVGPFILRQIELNTQNISFFPQKCLRILYNLIFWLSKDDSFKINILTTWFRSVDKNIVRSEEHTSELQSR